MAEKLIIPKEDPKFDVRSCGVVQGVPHDSLVEILRSAGYIRQNAVVRGLKIDEHSTQIYVD